jgi:hypothetical protein
MKSADRDGTDPRFAAGQDLFTTAHRCLEVFQFDGDENREIIGERVL